MTEIFKLWRQSITIDKGHPATASVQDLSNLVMRGFAECGTDRAALGLLFQARRPSPKRVVRETPYRLSNLNSVLLQARVLPDWSGVDGVTSVHPAEQVDLSKWRVGDRVKVTSICHPALQCAPAAARKTSWSRTVYGHDECIEWFRQQCADGGMEGISEGGMSVWMQGGIGSPGRGAHVDYRQISASGVVNDLDLFAVFLASGIGLHKEYGAGLVLAKSSRTVNEGASEND